MYRIRLFSSGRWFAVVGFALVGAVLASGHAAEEAAQDVTRDEHGAASVEHQEQALDELMSEEDVAQALGAFDPVILEAFVPEDNALTSERVALGRKLYFDKRLSQDGTVSCATCHDVTRGFTDQRPVSEGIRGQLGKRNAPTVLNAALLQTLFWDGRSPTLDHQARQPVLNPVEMGMPDEDTAIKAIADDAEYQKMFKEAYGRDINYEDLGRAIGAFERTLVFMDSPFRRFLAGDAEAISSEARAGWELFNGKGRCMTCHPMNSTTWACRPGTRTSRAWAARRSSFWRRTRRNRNSTNWPWAPT